MTLAALNNALSGMLATQRALAVVSNNVANANTEGYTRKIAQFESLNFDGQSGGVQIGEIARNVDEFLMRERREALGEYNELEIIDRFMEDVETLFGSLQDNNSISALVNDFGSALDAMSLQPEDGQQQQIVVAQAEELAERLNFMHDHLQDLREDADRQISEHVDEINDLLEEIDDLNVDIVKALNLNANFGSAGDFQDKRDVALNKLAELVDIAAFEQSDGSVTVALTSGKVLLDVDAQTVTHDWATALDMGVQYDYDSIPATSTEGAIDGIFVGDTFTQDSDITTDLKRGRIKGLIELRDEILPNLTEQLNELTRNLRDNLNAVHNLGTAYPPLATLTGTKTFVQNGYRDLTNQELTVNTTTNVAIHDTDGDATAETNGDDNDANFTSAETLSTNVLLNGTGVFRITIVDNSGSDTGEAVFTTTVDLDDLKTTITGATATNDTFDLGDLINRIQNSYDDSDGTTQLSSFAAVELTTDGVMQFRTLDNTNYGVIIDEPAALYRSVELVDAAGASLTGTNVYNTNIADTFTGLGVPAGITYPFNFTIQEFVSDAPSGVDIESFSVGTGGTYTTWGALVAAINNVDGLTASFSYDENQNMFLQVTHDEGKQLRFTDATGLTTGNVATTDVGESAFVTRLGLNDANTIDAGASATTTGLRQTATFSSTVTKGFQSFEVPLDEYDQLETSTSDTFTLTPTVTVVDPAGQIADQTFTFSSVTVTPSTSTLSTIAAALDGLEATDGTSTMVLRARVIEDDGYRIEIFAADTNTGTVTTDRNAAVNFDTSTTANSNGASLLGLDSASNPNRSRGFSHYFGLNDFFVDSKSLSTTQSIDVREDIKNDPERMSRATANNSISSGYSLSALLNDGTASATVTQGIAVAEGNNQVSLDMAASFNSDVSFKAIGNTGTSFNLSSAERSISDYASRIVSNTGLQAKLNADQLEFKDSMVEELDFRIQGISGVNIDEELSNLILLQNAFTASARVITASRELLTDLVNLVR